ncbi:MAG TPA: OmpA family protein [Segetibacter sp.]
MKNLLTLILLVTCFSPVFAQRSAIGFHINANEYIGDLNNHNYSLYKFKYFKVGGGISLQQYLNSSFNLMEMANYNRVQWGPVIDRTHGPKPGVDADFLSLNVMLKYKFNNGYLFKEEAALAPFLVGGLGVSHVKSKAYSSTSTAGAKIIDGETKPSLVLGAGVFFRFSDAVGLELSSIFNRPFYDAWDGVVRGGNDIYLAHSAGLIFSLKKPVDTDKDGVSDKKDQCPNTPAGVAVDSKGCPIDTDADGVADYIDKCPQQPGTAAMNGCPDTDNDGVADIDDKCPAVPGLAKFAGCPDSDNDGVQDSLDQCPNTVAGTPVDAKGCPLDSDGDKVPDNLDKCPNTPAGTVVDATGCPADSDGDGVLNAVDRCPNTPGPASNNGCPEVKEEVKKRLNFATRGIFFETGKAALKPTSFPKLDEIVSIINEYPDYNLRLGGHTDNVGSDANNLKLSQARIDAVKNYLVGKGVPEDRLEATGFGESKPIATNKTAAGRAQNRRVEMELYLK